MKRKVPCGGKIGHQHVCLECGRKGADYQNEGALCLWLVERDVTPPRRAPKHTRAKQAYPEIIRGMLARGETREALKLAAGFEVLGAQKSAITRAWSAVQRPEWYRSLGKDPAALEAEGIQALRERFGNGS